MAETDNPLKRLVTSFIDDFAPWLLESEVKAVQPLNVELPAPQDQRVDLVFAVVLASGKQTMLHIEFQGQSSRRPMKWRELEYMARLAEANRLDLASVVIYVGQGVGAKDTGEHQVTTGDGQISLYWRYRVVRLWQIKAETLLDLAVPSLSALIGQTDITQPEQDLARAAVQIQQVEDDETRGRLLNLLVTLIQDQELIDMLETLVEKDDLLMDTPFLQRIRNESKEEGLTEGLSTGRTEGQLIMLREKIVDVLILRFDPPSSFSRKLEQYLKTMTEKVELDRLFTLAIQAETFKDFQENSTQWPKQTTRSNV